MSALFGRLDLSGAPLPPGCLDAAAGALAAWGPDGGGRYEGDCVALGRQLLAVTPEPDDGKPLVSPDGTVVVAAARLDNRDELTAELGIPAVDRATTSDARIAQLAHLRWGRDCAPRLLGDWAFAAWDPNRRALLLARDAVGNRTLFWLRRAATFAFASDASVVQRLAGVPREIDSIYMAEYLALIWSGDSLARTPFSGVRQLLPGSTLSIELDLITERTYFRPFATRPYRVHSEADGIELIRERFSAAVRSRLRSRRPIAATLSAGLDSSSVTALAARELGSQPLLAYTAVPAFPCRFPGGLADEGPLAALVAQRFENIVHTTVRGTRYSAIGALDRALDLHLHPQHAVGNLPWLIEIFEEAQARDAGVLLTGQLGNATVSWGGGGNRVLYLLLAGRIDEGRRAMRAWRERRGVGWAAALRALVAGPVLRPLLFRLVLALGHGARDAILDPRDYRALGLGERAKHSQFGAHRWPPLTPESERAASLSMNAVSAAVVWQPLGARHGLEVRDPTSDVRLVDACASIPDAQWAGGGLERAVVRRAMVGVLPDGVRLNVIRGRQAADLVERLRAGATEIVAALAVAKTGPLVAHDRLAAVWSRVAGGSDGMGRESAVLLRGLMAARFLARVGSGADDRGPMR